MKEYERIKLRIRRTGLSFKEFAARAEIDYCHIGHYLNGFRRLQRGEMERLITALAVIENPVGKPTATSVLMKAGMY